MSVGQEILEMLKDEISENEYNRYIKQLKFDEKSSLIDHAYFVAPNKLIASWIKTKYSEKLAHLFEIKTESRPQISIVLESDLKGRGKKAKKETAPSNVIQSLLNASHTFENFVMGGSNQFAATAAKSVSEKPGDIYNPLFIYGGVGLGKTHLMQAVGNILQAKSKSVIFTTSEQYLNDFTRHLRNSTMERFREKYRKCDLLLIDDVQFFSGKTETQEEFFHTFEQLRNDGKQIIMTSDKHPKKIAGMSDRLISRMEWGLVADIQPPELETKIAIINKKCDINKIRLPKDVVNYIATVIENNVREIEGILSKIRAYAQLMHIEVDISFAQTILKEHLGEKKANVTIENILEMVSKELNVKPAEIRSKGRSRVIVYARRIAIYLARNLTTSSMPELAKFFGMKDHTAISHTMKKINELIKNDEDFRLKIDELSNKITSS